ncbi:MAG: transcriptional repressor LexA [Desulfuromonadales bacterium]
MLTEKQHYFFDYLKRRLREQGELPSLRQAAAELGKKGLVAREGRYSRTVRLLPEKSRLRRPLGRELPIIGRVTAGLPMYAQQEWDGSVVVDDKMFGGESLFCLRISGDSMRGAGIFDDDIAVCEPRQYAENGEIVAVLINQEEATVKRFFLRSDKIELHPENPDYEIMRYGFGDVLVQGKVVGIVRGMHPIFSRLPD